MQKAKNTKKKKQIINMGLDTFHYKVITKIPKRFSTNFPEILFC